MLARVFPLCALLTLLGCNTSKQAAPAAKAEAPSPLPSAEPSRKVFGSPLGASPAVGLADVLKAPAKFAEQSVLVEGEVRRACTRKGCWMELSETQDPAAAGCRVTVKGYGFFLPTHS